MRGDTIYAVSVESSTGPRLLCRLKRAPSGIYLLIPGEDRRHNVHVSYHVDGRHHIKSYGDKVFRPQKKQRLDGPFRGAEPLFALAIPPGYESHLTIPCRSEQFPAVFELGCEHFTSGAHHTLTVDLVEPNSAALPGPWQEQIWQESIRDAVPWILTTLWRGLIQ